MTPSNQFDSALAGTLYPKLVHLSKLSTTAVPTTSSLQPLSNGASDVEARAAKLELNKQASQLRANLNLLQTQAETLQAGDLSLQDQDWLINELQLELIKKRGELTRMADLTSFDNNHDHEERKSSGPDLDMRE